MRIHSWSREEEWSSFNLLNFTVEFIYVKNLVSGTIIAADLSTLITQVLQ